MPSPTPQPDLSAFPGLFSDDLLSRLHQLRSTLAPRLARNLGYYQNPRMDLAFYLPGPRNAALPVRPYRQFQELGLPARITGFRTAADGALSPTGPIDLLRKEVVIENDIAWRINTLVDFVAPTFPVIRSASKNPDTRQKIEDVLSDLFEPNNALALLQKIILMGAIHGNAWVLLHPSDDLLMKVQSPESEVLNQREPHANSRQDSSLKTPDSLPPDPESAPVGMPAPACPCALLPHLQVVDASRVLPIFHATPQGCCGDDALAFLAILHPTDPAASTQPGSALAKLTRWIFGQPTPDFTPPSFDLFSPTHWARYINGNLTQSGTNPFGFIPAAAYINQILPTTGDISASNTARNQAEADPLAFPDTPFGPALGESDIDPLIPLQDELNTRLSDRANRITLQSFRMYLAKGIEDFVKRPVGPGQMWSTDNTAASIEAFGGDTATPSEDNHIQDIRNAIDKVSGVTPIAAGLINGKIGHLTSAVALKITLIATLARTARKRNALAHTLQTLVRHVLTMLNQAGVLATTDDDRDILFNWPTAIPENEMDKLQEAQAKLQIGVLKETVLAELGY